MGWLDEKYKAGGGSVSKGLKPGGSDGGFSVGGLGGKSGSLGDWDIVGQGLDRANPYLAADRKAKEARDDALASAGALYSSTIPLNQKLDKADAAYFDDFKSAKAGYLNKAGNLVDRYTQELAKLKGQAESQATDATSTYKNSILPEYKNAMGLAKTNAEQAMTLAEAGDPNNPIMKQIRALYDQQGQAARQQGQQDFGILSALGAQAAQGQIYDVGSPMTSGQMGQIYAANQGQAGDAYARAQQRMYDLQQQGLDRGFDQSNLMYQLGQDAQDRYGNSIQALQGGENAYYGQQADFRDELGGYNADRLGVKSILNSDIFNMNMLGNEIAKGNAYAGTGREQNALNQYYGVEQQAINNDLQASMANNASKGQLLSSIVGGLSSYAGARAARQPQKKQASE